jgi:hypothetical protein
MKNLERMNAHLDNLRGLVTFHVLKRELEANRLIATNPGTIEPTHTLRLLRVYTMRCNE